MVLSLVIILTAIVSILFIVVQSTIAESSKLVASLQSGLTEIRSWLKDGPLGLTDESVDGLVTQAEAWGKTSLKVRWGLLRVNSEASAPSSSEVRSSSSA